VTTISTRSDNWIAYRRIRHLPRFRLFCFPFAGAGASIYRSWSALLPPEIETCPVQLPGREERIAEAPYDDLLLLVDKVKHELAPLLDREFAIFGHSMGALIGFELARQLQKDEGPVPSLVFVSGSRAPSLIPCDSTLHGLDDRDFDHALVQLGGTDDAVSQDPELLSLLRPTLRADFALCEKYFCLPEPPIACPISALRGVNDPLTTWSSVSEWRIQTQSFFVQRDFLGDHFFIRTANSEITRAITEDLSRLPR